MLPNPQKQNAAGGRRLALAQTNGRGLRRNTSAIPDQSRIVAFLIDTTLLVECAASVLIQGDRVSAAGRDVLLHRALRLQEIREALNG